MYHTSSLNIYYATEDLTTYEENYILIDSRLSYLDDILASFSFLQSNRCEHSIYDPISFGTAMFQYTAQTLTYLDIAMCPDSVVVLAVL